MKCKDFVVSGTMPNGMVLKIKCDFKQVGSVKKTLKSNGASDIQVKEDPGYKGLPCARASK